MNYREMSESDVRAAVEKGLPCTPRIGQSCGYTPGQHDEGCPAIHRDAVLRALGLEP